MMNEAEDKPYTVIYLKDGIPAKGYDEASDPGWYWYDSEYPEEGCCGPFETEEDAEAFAKEGYELTDKSTDIVSSSEVK